MESIRLLHSSIKVFFSKSFFTMKFFTSKFMRIKYYLGIFSTFESGFLIKWAIFGSIFSLGFESMSKPNLFSEKESMSKTSTLCKKIWKKSKASIPNPSGTLNITSPPTMCNSFI